MITFDKIKEEYFESEVCMGELLADISADGLTLEQAFELYCKAKEWADGDEIIVKQSEAIQVVRY